MALVREGDRVGDFGPLPIFNNEALKMAKITNISEYLLSITYVSVEDSMIRNHTLEPGSSCDVDDDNARAWANGPGLGFLKPSGDSKALCTVKFDKADPGVPAIKVFAEENNLTPDQVAGIEAILGRGDTSSDKEEVLPVQGELFDDSQEEPEDDVAGIIKSANTKRAIEIVSEINDLDLLERLFEVEERKKVSRAISARIEEINNA